LAVISRDIPLSFDAGPFRKQMGLQAIDENDWIVPGEDWREQLVEKRRLLAERHDEVFAALPETEDSGQEIVDMLFDHLPQRFPTRYPRMDHMIAIAANGELVARKHPALHPLDVAGRLVTEDLCLMRADAEGRYRLVAASLCFPSRWRLADKLDRPVGAIHGPVPDYDEKLERPVDRFFSALKSGRIAMRHNWTIHDRPDLFQPTGGQRRAHDVPQERYGEELHLRVERQTLRRLPRSGDVLFTIRTWRTVLGSLAPEVAHRLGAAVRALPEPERRYKGLTRVAEELAVWLSAR
jgi:hypothetical protein